MLVFRNLLFGGKDALKNIEIIADVNWLRRSLSFKNDLCSGFFSEPCQLPVFSAKCNFPAKSKTETTVLLAIQSYISLKR